MPSYPAFAMNECFTIGMVTLLKNLHGIIQEQQH